LTIRDIHEDRLHAEKDLTLGLYGRLSYLFIQSIFSVLPSICIWLAYLLPAHSMAGLYAYTNNNETGIYLYMGYMLLYLMAIQTLALFATHLLPSKISSAILTTILILALTSVGGYSIHPSNVPYYWSWLEIVSPEKWLLPVLTADEYSLETIASTAGLHLCRNKQVSVIFC